LTPLKYEIICCEWYKKAERLDISDKTFGNVPRKGLEPSHLAAPEPKSGVSTNFTTWAEEESVTREGSLFQEKRYLP
jgi:hypothetical protein